MAQTRQVRSQDILPTSAAHSLNIRFHLNSTPSCVVARAGFSGIHQSPVSILNTTYDQETYSYWLARLMAAFAAERQFMTEAAAEQWLEDLAGAQRRNEYMFCSIAVVRQAVR